MDEPYKLNGTEIDWKYVVVVHMKDFFITV